MGDDVSWHEYVFSEVARCLGNLNLSRVFKKFMKV